MQPLILSEVAVLFPEIFVVVSAIALLMFGVFTGDRMTATITTAAAVVLAATCYLLVLNLPEGRLEFMNMFMHDMFTTLGKFLVALAALLTLVIAMPWLAKEEHKRFEFPILFLLAVFGMMLMVSANDLLSLYLGIETSSLCLYVLAAFSRDEVKSTEAGLKYFVLSSLASGMLLFGISLVYGFTGATHFPEIAKALAAQAVPGALPIGATIGIVLMLVGFCFKLSAVPFHMWTPDVYEGAPTPVTAFFAGAPKIAAMILLVRVTMEAFAPVTDAWQQIVVAVAIASMVIGALGAITQKNIKRLLAYSSIGHMGFALVGVASATPDGMKAVVIYLAIYLFMNAGTFALVMLMQRGGEPVESIYDLAGISRTEPKFALLLGIFMFSMAGIPPLAGFFGKMYVFLAAVEANLIPLAVIGVLASVISCFYYLKIVKIMYFDDAGPGIEFSPTASIRALIALCIAFNVLFVFYPSSIILPVEAAVSAWLP